MAVLILTDTPTNVQGFPQISQSIGTIGINGWFLSGSGCAIWGLVVVRGLVDGWVFGGAYLGQFALGYGDVGPMAQRWCINRPLCF